MTRIMGFEPREVRHLVESAKHDLGTLDPNVRGSSIESVAVRFEKP